MYSHFRSQGVAPSRTVTRGTRPPPPDNLAPPASQPAANPFHHGPFQYLLAAARARPPARGPIFAPPPVNAAVAASNAAMNALPVIDGPQDTRRFADAILNAAVASARPGVPNVVNYGDDHPNLRGIALFEEILKGTLARNHLLQIGTVQFEHPAGFEQLAAINVSEVAVGVAATVGGLDQYLKFFPPQKHESVKLYYLMGRARAMGFNVECIDSPAAMNSQASMEQRDAYMTQRIRQATAQGRGVITLTGLAHSPAQQANLLRGTVVPGGPVVAPPINAVSISAIGGDVGLATRASLYQHLLYGIPASHALVARFNTMFPNRYVPVR